jgi:UDP-N-acetylmuramyl pentapeptide synthase
VDYTLISPVSNAIAAFAAIMALGLTVAFVAVALARISVDFFKG